jgi:NAD(P)-dependent dehydrogenase (short-subunit alcohol dehydrogenase family)
VAERISQSGGAALPVACDVADHASVAASAEAALKRFCKVDHLVNNAGTIEPIAPTLEGDPAPWERTLRVNLLGALHCCQALMPAMLRGVPEQFSTSVPAHRTGPWRVGAPTARQRRRC